jgi:predicted DNA-binding transcriptional regulator YafY
MRADRLLNILLLLQTHGKLTAQRLADELTVARRTILRDVEALSTAGIPIYTEGGPGGGIALDEHFQMALHGLNEADISALFVSGYPAMLNPLDLSGQASLTLLKLFAALPKMQQQHVEQHRQRLHIDPVWWLYEDELGAFWSD